MSSLLFHSNLVHVPMSAFVDMGFTVGLFLSSGLGVYFYFEIVPAIALR